MVLEDHFLIRLRSFFFLMGNQLQGAPCVFLSHAPTQQILWIVWHLDHEIVHDSGKKITSFQVQPFMIVLISNRAKTGTHRALITNCTGVLSFSD